MSLGRIVRQHDDPLPHTPIIVEQYSNELNSLVGAHNDLYDGWKPKTDLIDGTQITAGSATMAVLQDENMLGLNAAKVTGNGLVIQPYCTIDIGALSSGPVYDIGGTLTGLNCVYATYIFTRLSAGSTRKYVHFPTPITLPSATFGVPIGTVINVFLDSSVGSGGDLTLTWTYKEVPTATFPGILRCNSVNSTNNFRLLAVPGGYVASAIY